MRTRGLTHTLPTQLPSQLVKTGANIHGVFNSKDEPLYDVLQTQHNCFPGEIFADMTSMDLSVSAANVKKVKIK